ncbi:aromatic ring-hydroxylating dioxygenase subunit alpha [Rhodobacter sp. 24-YEA-8]|uniref:aromatic ring-hydroxylating oxygenase subunit alpha n=1 Tax=Rhodobacter sp. 24-YEA-8 TaxID=1884310 RepID=UPI00089480AA|nr:aromatic ring-hydroxylating dioxygenase subunit alpha [Rhodobacter sp. 24-YEA-8]SEC25771.1 Rieske 2Fe-2S family protein [Rhodobacter sp. 24-YEA-8]
MGALHDDSFSTPDQRPDAISRLIADHRPGHGLVRDFYMDPTVFARDMERVFRRHWHCLAHESVIPNPGDFELFRLGDEQVILTRDMQGEVHGLLNSCRHRGAEVCTKDKGNAKMFVCPYHAWTYTLDGALRAARLMPKDFDRAAHALKKVHVKVVEGLVFISFAKDPLDFTQVEQSLHASIGQYGWGAAKVAHRETYPIAANWKLAVENYVECYHCGPAHPEYSQTHALEQPPEVIAGLNAAMEEKSCALGLSVLSGNHWQNSSRGGEAVDVFRYALYEGASTGSEDGSPLAPLMGRFTDYDGGVTSIHLGGTTFLVCYPDHGMIYRFIPKTHDSCEMELIWLVKEGAEEGVDYDLDRLTWLWKVTTEEDKKIIEHTARGVKSHYFEPGPIAPMEYNELRYITWYLDEISRA